MSEAAFIAGDWGTSRLRLYLCDAAGQVLARGEGEGAVRARLRRPFCRCRRGLGQGAWHVARACCRGMVGSTIGWREVPYLKCPAKPAGDCGRGHAV